MPCPVLLPRRCAGERTHMGHSSAVWHEGRDLLLLHHLPGRTDLLPLCISAYRSWHHIKALIIGDMLIANFQKNYRATINVSFVYKQSFVVSFFPSLLLPPFLENDHRVLTSLLVLTEILSLFFYFSSGFFFLTLFFNAFLFSFLMLWKGLVYPPSC